jgi:hypothetical protein
MASRFKVGKVTNWYHKKKMFSLWHCSACRVVGDVTMRNLASIMIMAS